MIREDNPRLCHCRECDITTNVFAGDLRVRRSVGERRAGAETVLQDISREQRRSVFAITTSLAAASFRQSGATHQAASVRRLSPKRGRCRSTVYPITCLTSYSILAIIDSLAWFTILEKRIVILRIMRPREFYAFSICSQHCTRLRNLLETVAVLHRVTKDEDATAESRVRAGVRDVLDNREKLLLEVGRMVRLGRLLKTRLKEPLYHQRYVAEKRRPIKS